MWLMSDKREIERGQLGGPVEHSEGKGGESVVIILRFLCGSPRLCRLRTEGLIPVSKYWMYWSHAGDIGPVRLVICHQQMLGFTLIASRLAQERNWVRTRGSVSPCAVDCVRSPFSREQWPCLTPSTTHERLPRTGTTHRKRTLGVRVVLIKFSPTGCTSIRIAVTLGYE
jgi:hypothetical protein